MPPSSSLDYISNHKFRFRRNVFSIIEKIIAQIPACISGNRQMGFHLINQFHISCLLFFMFEATPDSAIALLIRKAPCHRTGDNIHLFRLCIGWGILHKNGGSHPKLWRSHPPFYLSTCSRDSENMIQSVHMKCIRFYLYRIIVVESHPSVSSRYKLKNPQEPLH